VTILLSHTSNGGAKVTWPRHDVDVCHASDNAAESF
jgi:hypothetical protein